MIGYDTVHARLLGLTDFNGRCGAAIHGDQQSCTAARQRSERRGVKSVAFVQAMGYVVVDIHPEPSQSYHHDGGTRLAISIVIAVHGHFFASGIGQL